MDKCRLCKRTIGIDMAHAAVNDVCWECAYWTGIINDRYTQVDVDVIDVDDCHVVVNGACYYIGQETGGTGIGCGHGGRKFTVSFFDGRIVTTTNLWCQGIIPERFRNMMMSDNAVFVAPQDEKRNIPDDVPF